MTKCNNCGSDKLTYVSANKVKCSNCGSVDEETADDRYFEKHTSKYNRSYDEQKAYEKKINSRENL